MPFRDDAAAPQEPFVPADPLARFMEIHDALETGRGTFADKVPLRLAAVTLLTTPGSATDLADAVRSHDATLSERLGWFSQVVSSTRLLIAAVLVKHGDDPNGFLDEAERVRESLRQIGLRRGGTYEFLAILVLRTIKSGQPIEQTDVERFQALYEEMKRHHWWLTGPEDFPACAMLVGRPGSPEQLGQHCEDLYQALRAEAGLGIGDALQTAANVLALGGLQPSEAAARFRRLGEAFKEAGQRIGSAEYDELAVLCFLAQPIDKIVASVIDYRDQLRQRISWLSKAMAFGLGTGLAFVRLLGQDARLGSLADAKMLLDMQSIVAARAAAAAATAAT